MLTLWPGYRLAEVQGACRAGRVCLQVGQDGWACKGSAGLDQTPALPAPGVQGHPSSQFFTASHRQRSSCDPTPSSEPAKSTRVVRHVSAFSTTPMTPDLCGRRHFLPFWSAGVGRSIGGHVGL